MVAHQIRKSDQSVHNVVGWYGCSPSQYGNVQPCITKHHRIERGAALADAKISFVDASCNLHQLALEHENERYTALVPISSSGVEYFRGDELVEVVVLEERPCLQQIEIAYSGLDAAGQHTVQCSVGYFSHAEGQPPAEESQPSVKAMAAAGAKVELKRPCPEPPKGGMKRVPSANAREGGLERNALASLSDTDLAARDSPSREGLEPIL